MIFNPYPIFSSKHLNFAEKETKPFSMSDHETASYSTLRLTF